MMELAKQKFINQLESDQIDFQRKFLVAMDSSTSERLQSNEIVFLDGTLNDEEENDDGAAYDKDDNNDEPECFFEGEEVDLSQTDGIVQMELATEIDDIDEPYQDSDGALYYICEKCSFVCIDHATLLQHSNENHPKSRPHRRQRKNNSALRSSDDIGNYYSDDSIHNQTTLSYEQATSTTLSLPSSSPSSPPPLEPLQPLQPSLSSSSFDDQKPYECEICHKRLSTLANLRGHITIHSSLRPFACHVCPKSFKQKRHLKYHQKIHNFKSLSIESNPNNEFAQNGESNGSYESNQESAVPAVVQLLPKIKKSINTVKNVPSILFQCNQCPKVFTQKCNLYRHQRSHTPVYPCEICQKKFKIEQSLHEHMKTHGVIEYLSEQ